MLPLRMRGESFEHLSALRWYHSIDLPGGYTTPGEYDLRPVVDRLPWPTGIADMRCLDVGSRDGFYAFEMERRGAREVISIDIDDPAQVHFPGAQRPAASQIQRELDDGHQAFSVARETLGSSVRRELTSVYELAESDLGRFDLAVVGTLLLHLRDPVRALTALRQVVDGHLILNEVVTVGFDGMRSQPLAHLYMEPGLPFWWVCNRAGLRRMAEAAGFEVVDSGGPYLVPNGAAGSAQRPALLSRPYRQLLRRLVLQRGAPHAWLLLRAAD